MRSVRSALVSEVVLPLRGGNRTLSSASRVRAQVAELALWPQPIAPPRRVARAITLTVRRHDGWPVYQAQPRRTPTVPAVTIVYLHGGCYVWQIDAFHWRLVSYLVRSVPARVVVPVYPLVPEGGVAADVVPAVADVVAEEIAAVTGRPGARIVVAGDSAGGGLALAAALVLRDAGRPQPDGLVLISPWLDATMTHPDQPGVQPRDSLLARPGMAAAGALWAGDLPVTDPLVSPLLGDLAGLPPMTVFGAGYDILVTDARQLRAVAGRAGVAVDYHEGDEQPHVYPLFPTPEGRAARAAVAAACRAAAGAERRSSRTP